MNRTLMLVAMVSTGAFAAVPTLAVSAGYSTQVFTARGYDLIGNDDNLHLGRVAVGTAFVLPLGWIDLEAAFASGGTTSTSHTLVPVQFSLKGLQLGVTWRVPVTSWFHPYVQVAGGYDWATLTLVNESRLTQTVGNVSGTGLLGVQFAVKMGFSKDFRAPWFIFDLGGGMVIRPVTRFDAMAPAPSKPAPEDPIAVGSVNLGSVPLSGFTGRLLVGVRY